MFLIVVGDCHYPIAFYTLLPKREGSHKQLLDTTRSVEYSSFLQTISEDSPEGLTSRLDSVIVTSCKPIDRRDLLFVCRKSSRALRFTTIQHISSWRISSVQLDTISSGELDSLRRST